MVNPGRYLVLLPPINGATAFSGTPYFTENPGDQFKGWDSSQRWIICLPSSLLSGGNTITVDQAFHILPAEAV